VSTELPRVLARDVVLVGIVFQNHHIGQGTNEAPLTHFFLEPQKEKNPVVPRNIHMLAEVSFQVSLLIAAQPTGVAATARISDTVIQPIQYRSLLGLDQEKNVH
jgi:hypothetical protein